MGVLSGKQILNLVKEGKLVIKPFEPTLVQPATLDLRVGSKVLASPLSAEIHGMVVELTEKEPSYKIHSGQMVGVLSYEKMELPLDICGRFGIRSTLARKGINAFGGLQLDPGWRGRLNLNLLNVGPEPIIISLHDPLFSVEFQKLEEPAEDGYSGSYQDQDDFPADQYNYILSARTTSLAEIPLLRKEMIRVSALMEELIEDYDPDEGFELKPGIKERLLKSAKLPRDYFISSAEMNKKPN